MRRIACRLAPLTVLVATCLPTAAHAATVSVISTSAGPTVDVVATGTQRNAITVNRSTNDFIVSDGGSLLVAGAGCGYVLLSVVCTNASIARIQVHAGDGDDQVTSNVANVALYAWGEGGNDALTGGDYGWSVLDGGAGDDVLDPGTGYADQLVGGAGADTATYATRAAGVTAYVGVGYSSGQAGEYDNIGADVEKVVGSPFVDVLVGSDGAQTLQGGAGADVLDGRDGDDVLEGGDGADTLLGREGADVLDGGAADDVLLARDSGVVDTVRCGDGTDAVTADREDVLDACETSDLPPLPPVPDPVVVQVPGPAVFVPQPAEPAAPAGHVPAPVLHPVVVTMPRDEPVLADAAKGTVGVTLGCPAAQDGGCKGSFSISAPVASKARKAKAARRGAKQPVRQVVLAKAGFKLSAGQTRKVTAKISRRGVTQAFGSTKQQASAKKGKKGKKGTTKLSTASVKATMTVTLKSSDGSETRILRPIVVELQR
ncbi:MAG: calcium-binding protein [Solirubrobacterales bacterium]|nr:calcium-binding protein [Solirubrobacterales bacterium]